MAGTVLVTDGDQRATLAVTRSLGRAGFAVEVCAAAVPSLAGASRWCSREHVVPDPLREPELFASAVGGICRSAEVRVLLPITDGSLLAVLPSVQSFGGARVPFPALATVQRASDKVEVTRIASELGLRVPPQFVVAAQAPVSGLTLRFPVVVKPRRSVVDVEGLRQKMGVVHARNPSELEEALGNLPREAFPVLVQERIVGPGVGVFFLLWEGRRLAHFVHRRLREKPPAGGVSVYAESVAPDPHLVDGAERLLTAFGWQGVGMVEFKRDDTGTPNLMEINGRFWGSLQLAIDAGVDFPRLLVEVALGHAIEPVQRYRVGVRTRWWWGDVDHLLTRLRHSARGLALPPGAPSRLRAVWDFVATSLRPDTRNEVLRLGDPRPALRETRNWFRRR